MMVINNNIPALNAYDIVNNTSNQLQKSIQKLSTGLRINSAADDAAGLSISEKMRAQINGLDQAVRNTQDGISLIQTAEGALTETHSILQRMRELSVQAANDTYTAQDRSYIQEEMDLLRDEIDHIGNTTTFNTKKLLNGDSAVLWSSDNLNTKALVRGGLRNIDQFGQKSSSEGNYKITVAAEAGTGEVQKTDIFKIKHDLDPYAVEGTGKFKGAVVEGEANLNAVGSRSIDVTVYDAARNQNQIYHITLNHDVKDNDGLAKAINLAVTNNEIGGTTSDNSGAEAGTTLANAKYNALGDKVWFALGDDSSGSAGTGLGTQVNFTAGTDNNGNLVITVGSGASVSITDSDTTDTVSDLSDVFGAADNSKALISQQQTATAASFAATVNVPANTSRIYTLSMKLGENTNETTFAYTLAAGDTAEAPDAATIIAGLQSAIDASDYAGALTVSYDNSTTGVTFTSTAGVMREIGITSAAGTGTGATAGTTTLGTVTYGDTVFTNAPSSVVNSTGSLEARNVVADTQETNFTHSLNSASISITLTDDASGTVTGNANDTKTFTITLSDSNTADLSDTDKLVADINKQLAANTTTMTNGNYVGNYIYARNDDGKVRLYSSMDMKIEDNDPATTAANAGSVNAIFGNGLDTTTSATTTNPPYSKTITQSAITDAGTTEDMLNVSTDDQTFAFNILDANGEELAKIQVTGGYEPTLDDDGAVTKTAAEKVVDEINSQLETAGLSDFKAVYNEDTDSISLYSGTRDFKLEDEPSTATKKYLGYEALFGRATEADAEKSETADNPLETIGMVAKGETVLRDIDKFWDSQGNFLLEDPQTITITQGDGQSTKVTLYKYDTVDDMVSKFNNAIANDLGQAKYLDETDENYKTALNSFVTFVENAEDSGQESVQGTMLIRTVAPGSTGTINFASNNEDLINALSLNTIKKADDSKYHVTVQDAHTGVVVNNIDDEKITNNVLVGRLHQNVDVEFNAMTGITATWDDDAKEFVLSGAYDETGDMSNGEVTYLHLTDNTLVLQIGANEGDDLGVNIGDMRSHALGLDKVLVTDHDSASRSIGIIDAAIDKVSTQRAKLGAYQNRLEHTAANLTTSAENLTASESRIRDTDMAKTMMDFTKLQIMLQAGNSMLAQANQLPQNVLSLIR